MTRRIGAMLRGKASHGRDRVAGITSVNIGPLSRSLRTEYKAPLLALAARPVALETRWRAAAPELKAFVAQLTVLLMQQEDGQGARQRARKRADQEKLERAIEAICCNLAAISLFDPQRALEVKLGNYASGFSPIYGKHFNRAIALMEEEGLLTLTRGRRFSQSSRTPSTILPTPRYRELAPKLEDWNALHLEELREAVTINTSGGEKKSSSAADKERLRGAEVEMRQINESLRQMRLRYIGNESVLPAELPGRKTLSLLTPHHRSVRRVFKGSTSQGGRLYDGFWETMPRRTASSF